MQSGVVVDKSSISGALSYVTGYTGFSSDTNLQSGNFLAIKVATNRVGAVTTVELINDTSGPVTLDSGMNIVLRISNPETQSVRIVTTKDGISVTKTYDLIGLTCGQESVG